MLYSGAQIVSRIKHHIRKRGGTYNTWFVGVSRKPSTRLFEAHGVRKSGDYWILMHAESSGVARRVKSYLMGKIGISGANKQEDKAGDDFVYAYKKTDHTKP